jgi:ABC-type transporter Mla subunit MlaD
MMLAALPLSLRLPLLAAIIVFAAATGTTHLALYFKDRAADRQTERLAQVYLDGLAAAIADISNSSQTLAGLLSDERPRLQQTLGKLETIQQPFADQPERLSKLLSEYPTAINLIGRAGGVYGDFFNFYLCDLSLTLNGLQPGGPVRKVRITKQPTGRCTPQ